MKKRLDKMILHTYIMDKGKYNMHTRIQKVPLIRYNIVFAIVFSLTCQGDFNLGGKGGTQ